MKPTLDEIFSGPVRADGALLFRNAYELTQHLMERTPQPGSHFLLAPPTWKHASAFHQEIAAQVRGLVERYKPKVGLCDAVNSSTLVAPEWVAIFRKGRGNALLEGAAVAERMRAYIVTQGAVDWLHWRMYLARADLHVRDKRMPLARIGIKPHERLKQ